MVQDRKYQNDHLNEGILLSKSVLFWGKVWSPSFSKHKSDKSRNVFLSLICAIPLWGLIKECLCSPLGVMEEVHSYLPGFQNMLFHLLELEEKN